MLLCTPFSFEALLPRFCWNSAAVKLRIDTLPMEWLPTCCSFPPSEGTTWQWHRHFTSCLRHVSLRTLRPFSTSPFLLFCHWLLNDSSLTMSFLHIFNDQCRNQSSCLTFLCACSTNVKAFLSLHVFCSKDQKSKRRGLFEVVFRSGTSDFTLRLKPDDWTKAWIFSCLQWRESTESIFESHGVGREVTKDAFKKGFLPVLRKFSLPTTSALTSHRWFSFC